LAFSLLFIWSDCLFNQKIKKLLITGQLKRQLILVERERNIRSHDPTRALIFH